MCVSYACIIPSLASLSHIATSLLIFYIYWANRKKESSTLMLQILFKLPSSLGWVMIGDKDSSLNILYSANMRSYTDFYVAALKFQQILLTVIK